MIVLLLMTEISAQAVLSYPGAKLEKQLICKRLKESVCILVRGVFILKQSCESKIV